MSHDFGKRLLSHLIDQRARDNHKTPWASIPINATSVASDYRDVSYQQLANAINRCAQWLIDNIPKSVELEPVAYIGPHDIRYHIAALAGPKSGHVVSWQGRYYCQYKGKN